jgi:FkbM family methyltransferase
VTYHIAEQLMRLIFLRHLFPKSVRRATRERWNELEERRLYRQFIAKGDLVFDVGANVGLKTKTFLALGARVIAVEPNPACENIIRSRCRRAVDGGLLRIVPRAVGARSGNIELYIHEMDNTMSSGSKQFIAACDDVTWRKIDVEMVTLDDLIRRFGAPDFIKVDVEGMDAEVLQGLRERPKFMSFEYNLHPNLRPNTARSVREALRLGFTEANLTELATPGLLLNEWVPLAKVEAVLTGHQWGDVFVR